EGKQEIGRARIEDHPEVRELFAWYVENQWNPWAYAERPRRKAIAFYNHLFSLQQAIASEGADTPLELVWEERGQVRFSLEVAPPSQPSSITSPLDVARSSMPAPG